MPWSLSWYDSLIVYIQQILEQYFANLWSLEPAQRTKRTFFGCLPSEGRTISPRLGPEACSSLSSSMEVRMSGCFP